MLNHSIEYLNDTKGDDMSSPSPKLQLFAHFAGLARALGNEHRLELLEFLAQGPQSVEALTTRTGLTFANVSQHLQHLRKAGLVACAFWRTTSWMQLVCAGVRGLSAR